MSSEHRLRHHGFIYESDDEYVARSVGFLEEGLEAGEACLVGNTRDGNAIMREALGENAERVTFYDVGSLYTRPARSLATYNRTFLEQLQAAPSVRAVANGQFGRTPLEWNEWATYEALTNLAYPDLPVWVVCAYDANRTPEPALEAVRQTHSEILSADWQASEHYEDPRETVRRLMPEPEPLPDLRSWSTGDDLERFREQIALALLAENVPATAALHTLVASTQIASNALIHGGGIEEVRTGTADGRFVCEVIDRGSGFDDPAAGYIAPRRGRGNGLWVARQLTWRLEAFGSPRGFTVRLWA
ncbi:MAG TPA: sensor histidine kinase [Solirubrobacteraceae bacterium]|jgi:anti-sigma regulatory factor (Ser/Thr protein kinase)